MKKILITGTNSYIGTSFERWLMQWPEKYQINTIDMQDSTWRDKNFSDYDTVFHVAGIAHIKEKKENENLYYKVNRDLVYEVAQKSKNDGVNQFIFLSSMSVYGIESGVIQKNTTSLPINNYGRSKLQAEELIASLKDDFFKISIIRPPMVYGKGCKGNYPRLAALAKKLPFFADIKNERSMIYIDNLCEFVRLLIDDCTDGLFFPQNEEYVCTASMVKLICEAHGKKMHMTKILNPLLKLVKTNSMNKVFGNMTYDRDMSEYNKNYCVYDFYTSIMLTEEYDIHE